MEITLADDIPAILTGDLLVRFLAMVFEMAFRKEFPRADEMA